MLDYKILNTKPSISENGDEYMDLLANNYKVTDEVPNGTFVTVTENYVARPDLISQAMYGTDDYADIICKYNGISNPFELNKDDLLFIPNMEFVSECVRAVNKPSTRVKENNKLNIVVNNDHRKKLNEKRTANELTVNNENYIIDKSLGIVFY